MFLNICLKQSHFANIFDFTCWAVLAHRRVTLGRRHLHLFLVAGQKFLEGLRSLPSYKDAQQKQLRALLKQLGSVTDLTTGQSGKILSMLDEKLWDHESLQQLRQQIADKTEQIPGEAQGRRSLQDFVELPNYLTDSLWQTLLDRKTSGQEALELVCQHAALLGLRLPSESTMAMLLTLAYQGQALAMSGKAKFHLQQKQKPLIRKLLAGPRPLVDDTASRMDRFACRVQGASVSWRGKTGAHPEWMRRFLGRC